MAVFLALPDYKDAGTIGDVLGAVTTIFGLRNNILNVTLGISYERALFWHKIMASCTVGVICIHILTGVNISGLVLIVVMVLMSSIYLVKNSGISYGFEIFYYTHTVCMILLMMSGVLHGVVFISLAGLLWLIDVVMRSSTYLQCEAAQVNATTLPGDVVRLTFLKPIKYQAGQYVFLRIPEISVYEFHPFSISSAPHEDFMKIHIRELGDWTRRLGNYVRSCNAESGVPLTLDVMVDGSYGSHMINLNSSEYETVVLISGGIGITPNQSVYNNLIAQVEGGRRMRKVFFIWAVKDRALVNSMTPDLLSTKMSLNQTPLSFQPGMCGQPSCKLKVTDVIPFHDDNNVELVEPSSELIFENRFYLTRVREENEFESANIDPIAQPWLKFGRPDIPALFEEIRGIVKREITKIEETSATLPQPHNKVFPGSKISRVAVSVCGPTGMVKEVQDLCRLSRASDVIFDCHAEVFDM